MTGRQGEQLIIDAVLRKGLTMKAAESWIENMPSWRDARHYYCSGMENTYVVVCTTRI